MRDVVYLLIVITTNGLLLHIILKLLDTNGRLINYIMTQQDVKSFKLSEQTKHERTDDDISIEKEQKEFSDYMNVLNSGICDDKDVKRFGTVTVDQG